jgi:cytochrome b involved in lipid metabolism
MNKKLITVIVLVIIAIVAIILINKNNAPVSTPPTTEVVSTATTTYTLADVSKHATKSDCWTAVNGGVYDLTSFIPNHPGGEVIVAVCGKDGTADFEGQHNGQRDPAKELASHKIGVLVQ